MSDFLIGSGAALLTGLAVLSIGIYFGNRRLREEREERDDLRRMKQQLSDAIIENLRKR